MEKREGMSDGDEGAPKKAEDPKKPAPPRPGAKPPPPVPTTAKAKGTAPLAPKTNPFLEREASRDVDAGWLASENSADAPPVPPAPVPPVPPAPAPPEQPAPPEPAPIPERTAPPATEVVPPPSPEVVAPAAPPAPVAVARVEELEQVEQPPTAPREAKKSRVKPFAFALVAVAALVGGGFAYRRQTSGAAKMEPTAPQSSASATASAEPSTGIVEAVPPPTSMPSAPPSASAPKKPVAAAGAAPTPALSADPETTGIVDTTALPAGRKVIVDGRYVGSSPHRLVVRCGSHRFQVGDLPPEIINLPCGGEVNFTD